MGDWTWSWQAVLDNKVTQARQERDEARAEVERLRARAEQADVRLAACGAAALGFISDPARPGDYGWSASYGDVLNLRAEVERLRGENERFAQATEAMLRRSERALERAEKAEAEVERLHSIVRHATLIWGDLPATDQEAVEARDRRQLELQETRLLTEQRDQLHAEERLRAVERDTALRERDEARAELAKHHEFVVVTAAKVERLQHEVVELRDERAALERQRADLQTEVERLTTENGLLRACTVADDYHETLERERDEARARVAALVQAVSEAHGIHWESAVDVAIHIGNAVANAKADLAGVERELAEARAARVTERLQAGEAQLEIGRLRGLLFETLKVIDPQEQTVGMSRTLRERIKSELGVTS